MPSRTAPPPPAPAAPAGAQPPAPSPLPWWRRHGVDLLIAAVLLVAAFLSRRHGLPTDGLWLDDADPGAAVKVPLSKLITAGEDHPGFIILLKGWRSLFGGGDALAYPAFIAGILGPPLLYLGLRRLGYARSISALLGAALVSAVTDIVNSGRVRTFTIDLLVVLGMAVVLPWLVRRRWRWTTGLAWLVVTSAIASISGFSLAAVAIAAAIVVLHPVSDLRVRLVAVGLQAAGALALFVAEGNTYSSSLIEKQYRQIWHAFPNFHANPIDLGNELVVHMRRVAQAFPAGPEWLALICGLAAVAGLVIACLRGRQAVAGRYLGLVLLAIVVGSFLGIVPFGTTETNPINNGYRVSLWLVPIVAFGLAVVLQRVRGRLAGRGVMRIGFDAAVFVGAAAVLVSAGPAVPYPFPGAGPAARYIQSHVGRHDVVLVPFHDEWSFTTETQFAPVGTSTPTRTEGYDPLSWVDPRIQYVGRQTDAADVAPQVRSARRVFVYYPSLQVRGLVPAEIETRSALTTTLSRLGFGLTASPQFKQAVVEVWSNGDIGIAQKANLGATDLPGTWVIAPTAPSLGIFGCLHVPVAGTAANGINATNLRSRLRVSSQAIVWPSAAAARSAFAALDGPQAVGCIRSTSQAALTRLRLSASITVRRAAPPPTRGAPAIGYAGSAVAAGGTRLVARGTAVYITRGRTSVLITEFSGAGTGLPAPLMARLAGVIERRLPAR